MTIAEVITMDKVLAPWLALHDALGIASPIADEAHYAAMVTFTESLADSLPDDASDPGWGLVNLLAERISAYEDRAHPWPDLAPHALLQELMTEHGLSQKDLPEVGTQSVISELLAGKRKLNLRQVKALALRFGVPMDVFAADA